MFTSYTIKQDDNLLKKNFVIRYTDGNNKT